MKSMPHRMVSGPLTSPLAGQVHWSPVKSLWFFGMALLAIAGLALEPSWSAFLLSGMMTVITLCLGHSVGLHRLLIHRSFCCPRWLEYALVHLGTLVGMGGPFSMLYLHEIRDWAQRHPECHPFFIHRNSIWKDFQWQLHGEIRLDHAPVFTIEKTVWEDRYYRFLQRTWMLQQLPYAVIIYALGGFGWMASEIGMRVVTSLIGHWLVGYCAHNFGQRTWHLEGHAVQGYNLPRLGLLTMGECWHNNHHAYPESARLGHGPHQMDPGWWAISALAKVGLVWNIQTPGTLPERTERHVIG
jgi:fatty-acid desaturase